ncbi:hypothetical protein GUITHDRAFT_151199 [Guillardia theta CCMP2712]|uniref:Uncharacterized protein n=1 Tax=Guillardia theta (strain CCMP2712) TaxID=905079 RepID=L1JPT9_GUITC|nr:hypothetical protein GUITHDRAFT_151199 [Guillardia theta CCMP2712]EKX50611.1 hypothetical protein GUITHDRAFT_151199 [Guillardia theta CCMP2712]|eukprot:XP_005837591.1 hypothetical protein GUITHDRAFT_151199 [Guillardia theta CCMP2712]
MSSHIHVVELLTDKFLKSWSGFECRERRVYLQVGNVEEEKMNIGTHQILRVPSSRVPSVGVKSLGSIQHSPDLLGDEEIIVPGRQDSQSHVHLTVSGMHA